MKGFQSLHYQGLIDAHFHLILLSIPFSLGLGSCISLSMHPLNSVTFEIGLICDFLTLSGLSLLRLTNTSIVTPAGGHLST